MNRKIICNRFALEFQHNGKLVGDVGGFYLKAATGELFMPNDTYIEDGRLIVPFGADGHTQFTFEINCSGEYIGFELVRVRNFPYEAQLRLIFEVKDETLRIVPHRYVVKEENGGGIARASWEYMSKDETLGGFSVYKPHSPEDEDEILLNVWGNQNVAHPRTEDGKWSVERAHEWIDTIKKEYSGCTFISPYASSLGIEAATEEELYFCAEFAVRKGADSIYLMPWVWRDGFWPVTLPNDGINPRVFPNGVADVKRFSKYLEDNGMKLLLHNVCGGIGFLDPVYVRPNIDERLASWGRGVLERPVSDTDTEIYFRPEPGTKLPFFSSSFSGQMDARILKTDVFYSFFGCHVMALENELIRVGSFDTDGEVWILHDCIRSYGTGFSDGFSPVKEVPTTAAPHEAGARVRGLIDTYGINLLPDPKTDMLREVAMRYAETMLNECNTRCAIYDGFEIHAFGGLYHEKYAEMIYEATVRPATVITSFAVPPRAYFEQRLNCIKGDLGNAFYSADLRLHRPSWTSSSLTAVNFMCSHRVSNGYETNSVRDHHCGMNADIIRDHGLAEATFDLLADWKEASGLLSDEQRKAIKRTECPLHYLKDSGNHPYSPYVQTLTKDENNFYITPRFVSALKSNDPYAQRLWTRFGQEQGVVEMRQYFTCGDTVELTNDADTATPTFLCRVMHAVSTDDERNTPLVKKDTVFTNDSDTDFSFDGEWLTLEAENASDVPRYNQNRLISWSAEKDADEGALQWDGIIMRKVGGKLDLSNSRGIAMTVEGDGSGSVLVFSFPGRDYPVCIDFTGEREIIIPNGEYAWCCPSWGWSMIAWKFVDYSSISELRIQLGRVNPNTRTRIRVKNIRALAETEGVLVNPVFSLDGGTLAVSGEVHTDEQMLYNGGSEVIVTDLNYNELRRLPAVNNGFVHAHGGSALTLTAANKPEGLWVEYAQETPLMSKQIVLPRK